MPIKRRNVKENRRIAQRRIRDVMDKHKRKQNTRRQAEWRNLQAVNFAEGMKAKREANGFVPMEVDIKIQARITKFKKKWNTDMN